MHENKTPAQTQSIGHTHTHTLCRSILNLGSDSREFNYFPSLSPHWPTGLGYSNYALPDKTLPWPLCLITANFSEPQSSTYSV